MNNSSQKKYPPRLVASRSIEGMSAAGTDAYLQNGWFRYGTQICADCIRLMSGDVGVCVMLRIPLENFAWKKRLLKLKRRNDARFQTQIRPFGQSPENEALWQRFKTEVHGWKFVPRLEYHLFKAQVAENYPTFELAVYDGEKLVALSFFDRGERSMAALEAAYLPEYKSHSLGLYTMLLEIEYGISQGLSFYYPGFYPKGVSMFDYKLRTGGIQFFSQQDWKWHDWQHFSEKEWVGEAFLGKINGMKQALRAAGLQTMSAFLYFENHEPGNAASPVDAPLLLLWRSNLPVSSNLFFMASWDLASHTWRLFLGVVVLGAIGGSEKSIFDSTLMVTKLTDVQLLGVFKEEQQVMEVSRKLKMVVEV